jgi:hypothetical protein
MAGSWSDGAGIAALRLNRRYRLGSLRLPAAKQQSLDLLS